MKTGSEQFPNLKAFKLTLMMLLKTIFFALFIYLLFQAYLSMKIFLSVNIMQIAIDMNATV